MPLLLLLLLLCAGAATPSNAAPSPAPDGGGSGGEQGNGLVASYSPGDLLSVDDPAYNKGDWLLGKADSPLRPTVSLFREPRLAKPACGAGASITKNTGSTTKNTGITKTLAEPKHWQKENTGSTVC